MPFKVKMRWVCPNCGEVWRLYLDPEDGIFPQIMPMGEFNTERLELRVPDEGWGWYSGKVRCSKCTEPVELVNVFAEDD